MAEQDTTKRFAYDVSWIVSAYLNACILASTAAAEEEPEARIPVSFQYLIFELDHSRYTGRALPRSLQDLLTVPEGRHAGHCAVLTSAAALSPLAPRTIDVEIKARGESDGGGGGGGRVIAPKGQRRNYCDGEVIPNPRPIQRLCILTGIFLVRDVPGRGLTHPRRCCLLKKVAHGVHLFWELPAG